MNISRLRRIVKQAGFYVPITLNFVVFALVAGLAFQWLYSKPINPGSAFADVFQLLIKVVAWFTVVLLSVAFLSVFISWLFFLFQKKKKKTQFKISAQGENPGKFSISIRPVLKPFLGTIKTRFLYDGDRFSKKLLPVISGEHSLLSTSFEGEVFWNLPQIKEYQLKKAIVYFEDLFQFFSIAVNMDVNESFVSKPRSAPPGSITGMPRKTEETSTRIDEIRKVEGEFLNYKNFETQDDVRRIVWKIYAKNKELVVRIPEVLDPFASHVYIYPSFYSAFDVSGNDVAEIPFLNYFKEITWTVYQSLVKQGYQVRYITDQEIAENYAPTEKDKVQFSISTSHWHKQKDLRSFVNPNEASFIIISSLSDAAQVEELVERHSRDIAFIYVKLTNSLKDPEIMSWIKWLFVQSKPGDMDIYRRDWSRLFSLRREVSENEKKLEKVIEQYQLKKITV